jgi:pSer/pThr/pTyr-binding forkhead associated (FHA) protein
MKQPPVIVVQLVHILGPLKGEIQEFSEASISVGRHPSCQVRFPAETTNISRKHAEILREGNQFKLIDHSTNGTFLNGKKVKEAYLKNGDVLGFSEGGPKVSFLSQIREAPIESEKKAAPPPPPKMLIPPPHEASADRVAQREPPPKKPEPPPPRLQKPAEPSVERTQVPLVVQYGPFLRSFKELPITIGRSPKCEFALEHPALFDQHAQVFFSQNQYWIKDLTGQKSVRINGQPIPFQAPLNVNDELALSPGGPVFRFLGEGRMAEVVAPSIEEPKKEESQPPAPEEKDAKKGPSVFKKFFRH